MKRIPNKLCSCHGQSMRWYKDSRYRKGGYYRCLVRDAETSAEWRKRNPEKHYLQIVRQNVKKKALNV